MNKSSIEATNLTGGTRAQSCKVDARLGTYARVSREGAKGCELNGKWCEQGVRWHSHCILVHKN